MTIELCTISKILLTTQVSEGRVIIIDQIITKDQFFLRKIKTVDHVYCWCLSIF